MSVTITSPSANGQKFPDPVKGDYAIQAAVTNPKEESAGSAAPGSLPPPPPPCKIPVGYEVTVTISSASAKYNKSFKAGLTCITDTTGTWEVPRPADLPDAKDYVISATDGNGSDQKTEIHKP